ncbi:hypothetical protein JHK87_000701 [Glycine soja]|nr:hypothetical protein JHK87_000701 [Glycine soja]
MTPWKFNSLDLFLDNIVPFSFCSKIGRLTLAKLLTALDMLSSQHDGRKSNSEEVLQLYTDLMKLDPTHSIYYKEEHSLIPLKLLKSLKVLNISYNELGSHSIDTTGYLCSSPVANTKEFAWDRFEILTGSFSATKFWEAFLIFGNLALTELNINITGNMQ